MNDFAAIDFETANKTWGSVCSVGIVIVRNRVVTKNIYKLIRPRPNYYSYWTTQIHGLTVKDTNTSPDFPEVWEEIIPEIERLPLVAHNSSFDAGCLKAVHRIYEMPYPDYKFYCTCRAARKRFPQLSNHKLPTVAKHCGFDLANHHHALADAEACAMIALQIL
ncbi:MAG: 3'-5' exonuclease [Bacteroidales bacterium]|nr:3'-5' exonuclease [Bacteroidales bacterium]